MPSNPKLARDPQWIHPADPRPGDRRACDPDATDYWAPHVMLRRMEIGALSMGSGPPLVNYGAGSGEHLAQKKYNDEHGYPFRTCHVDQAYWHGVLTGHTSALGPCARCAAKRAGETPPPPGPRTCNPHPFGTAASRSRR